MRRQAASLGNDRVPAVRRARTWPHPTRAPPLPPPSFHFRRSPAHIHSRAGLGRSSPPHSALKCPPLPLQQRNSYLPAGPVNRAASWEAGGSCGRGCHHAPPLPGAAAGSRRPPPLQQPPAAAALAAHWRLSACSSEVPRARCGARCGGTSARWRGPRRRGGGGRRSARGRRRPRVSVTSSSTWRPRCPWQETTSPPSSTPPWRIWR